MTELEVEGELRRLGPLVSPTRHNIRASDLLLHGSDWPVLSERGGRALRVTILGGSVSSGCGSVSPEMRCELANSWPRLLKDRLDELLRVFRYTVHVRLFARNAVTPDYFQQCLANFVGDADVVLIELEANILGAEDVSQLEELCTEVQAAAPRAALGMVGW